jgi:hypothetical protein
MTRAGVGRRALGRPGYTMGPTLAPDESPWPTMWEQDDPTVDACPHSTWECCLLAADGLHRTRIEEVVRCVECHAPRCGHSMDEDPCMLVRHHRGLHFALSGQTEPVGGYLH